jgi:hypothetical protein
MERGHSVITTGVLEQALSTILPRSSMMAMGIIAEDLAVRQIAAGDPEVWVCESCGWVARGFEPAKCTVCSAGPDRLRKLDRRTIESLGPLEGAIEEEQSFDQVKLKWTEDARALVSAMPDGYQRRRAKARIEKKARVQRAPVITLEMVEEVVDRSQVDTALLEERGSLGRRAIDDAIPGDRNVRDGEFSWTPDAVARLNRVPEGFMRKATRARIENIARRASTDLIDLDVVEKGIAEGLLVMEEMIRKRDGDKGGEA